MKIDIKTTALITLVGLLPLGSAFAQEELIISDEMIGLVQRLVSPSRFGLNQGSWQDGACGNFELAAAPDGAVETHMCGGPQVVAPMARSFLPQVVCNEAVCPRSGDGILEQIRIGRDPMPIVRNNGLTQGGELCEREFDFEDWRQQIRTIWAGPDGSGTPADCSAEERIQLVNNWSALWGRGCAGGDCQELAHVFRPSMRSAAVPVLQFLVGFRGFCNGDDQSDKDPIRRPCTPVDNVCGEDGSLGLVLPVVVPQDSLDEVYVNSVTQAQKCAISKFRYASTPDLLGGACPYDRPALAGLCLYPVTENQEFGCLARQGFLGRPSLAPSTWDPRNYNRLDLRQRNGRSLVRFGDYGNLNHWFRLREGCDRGVDSTDQMACIVQETSCSMALGSGHALRPMAAASPQVSSLRIEGAEPGGTEPYALDRQIYINSILGSDQATGQEARLLGCVRDHKARLDASVQGAGFLSVPEVEAITGDCEQNPLGFGLF